MDRTVDAGREKRIFEQWTRFQAGEEVDAGVIGDTILDSWGRCRTLDVDPEGPGVTRHCENLKETLEKNALLISCSLQFMRSVFPLVAQVGTSLALASADGVILHRIPETSSGRNVGTLCVEQYAGTTGLATCLVARKPVEVYGAEHYCRVFHDSVCFGEPIFQEGKMVGVLGITSHISQFHPHTRALLHIVVTAIGEQMRLHALMNSQRTLMDLIDTGVILLDGQGCIRAANGMAARMLDLPSVSAGRQIRDFVSFTPAIEERMLAHADVPYSDVSLALAGGGFCPCVLAGTANAADGSLVLSLRSQRQAHELASSIAGLRAFYTFDDIRTCSDAVLDVLRQGRLAARSRVTVLVLGESGTGKELLAHAIHNASDRRDRPFVAVNCGALPRELVQSELFGYSEGAFTGASRHGKPGKFELADGGTIFLDEIGEMALDVQVSLLRLLQNRAVMRVGGRRPHPVDVRVIAATNRDLGELVREGLFREDLYYRINGFALRLPSLRERGREDVETLARNFADKFCREAGKSRTLALDGRVLDALAAWSWPGNIRELANTIERAVYLCEGDTIGLEHLPESLRAARVAVREDAAGAAAASALFPDLSSGMKSREAEIVAGALRSCNGNVSLAADALGVSRGTMYYRINRLGLDPRSYRRRGKKAVPVPAASAATASDGREGLEGVGDAFTPAQMEILVRLLGRKT